MTGISTRRASPGLVAVLGFAFIVRLLYLFEQGTRSVLFYQPLLDELELTQTAQRLLNGEGFGPEPFFKAPLYPVILASSMAIFGEGWFWVIRLLQHLAGVLVVYLGYATTRMLLPSGKSRHYGSIGAAIFLALYAPLIRLEENINLDSLLVFLQSTMLFYLVRATLARSQSHARFAAIAGIFAALSWLTRPTITLVIPFLAIWLLLALQRAKPAVLFVLIPAIAAGVVGLRNYVIAGEALVLPWQGGYNLYEANRRGTNGRYLLQSEFAMSDSANPTHALAIRGYARSLELDPVPAHSLSYSAINRYWMQRATEEIRADIPAWITLMARKVSDLTSDREIFNYEEYDLQRELSYILRFLPFSFGCIFPFALASIAMLPAWPRSRRSAVQLVWFYAVCMAGAISLYYTSGRLRMPLAFPATVLGAAGLSLLLTRRCRRAAYIVAFLTLGALGAFASWGDWRGVRSENHRAIDYARMSNAAFREARLADALKFARAAGIHEPNYPTLPLLRGQALYGLGKKHEAAAEFKLSLQRLPQDPVAPYNLGIYEYYEDNDTTAALDHFLEAGRRQPTYQRAFLMQALASVRLRNTTSATEILQSLPAQLAPELQLLNLTVLATLDCANSHQPEAAKINAAVRQRFTPESHKEFIRDVELATNGRCFNE